MQVLIDDNAGFCFGVVKAITMAENYLATDGRLFCLGEIVHNSVEVDRLRGKGLQVIDYEQLEAVKKESSDAKVLIRAHGEPPSTYSRAKAIGIELIDATCPIVLGLQRLIRQGYEEMERVGGQIVIFGKPGHAEVIGLNGQTNNSAIIVSSPDEMAGIDFSRPIRLFSQTTKNKDDYMRLADNIRARLKTSDFVVHNTICGRVVHRTQYLEAFARSVEAVIFVGGQNSSNAHYLFGYCKSVQPNSHFISDPGQLESDWYAGCQTVGITGATSTPRWLMEQVREAIING